MPSQNPSVWCRLRAAGQVIEFRQAENERLPPVSFDLSNDRFRTGLVGEDAMRIVTHWRTVKWWPDRKNAQPFFPTDTAESDKWLPLFVPVYYLGNGVSSDNYVG